MVTTTSSAATTIVHPGQVLRWEYVVRLAVSLTVFLAAVFDWQEAPREVTLGATGIVLVAVAFTVASAAWSEIYRRRLSNSFLVAQILFDLALVTAMVHITGGAASQFAALYVLIIVTAALVLSVSAALLIAGLASVLYVADVALGYRQPVDLGLWLQIAVLGGVALSSAYIATRLREARASRAELEAELAKVRLQAEEILRNIRSGIVTVDADGGLLYANPAAGALLGLDFEGKAGQPVLGLIEPVSPALAMALERAVRKGIRTTRAEGRVALGDRHFPIGLNTTVTTAGGNGGNGYAGATAIFQDISDQKRLDTLHMRTQRLEAVAELSASLAHEIKNPLASIRSAVEQLAQSPRATPDERTLAGLIVRESDRLSRLLSEFLDFSRVRVSRIERIDIGKVARGAANLAATHPGRPERVAVVVETPPTPLLIEGDEDLLHRAVFNLVLNALQASPAGGTVRVLVTAVTPGDEPAGVAFDQGGAAIRVIDEGDGIPPEVRDRLFDPFFTTKPGGSGLGLAIVHRAIESHRGFVFVDSDDGGTRVAVLLPREQLQQGD